MPGGTGQPIRGQGGRLLPGKGASDLARKGGKAKANRRKLMDSLGLLHLEDESSFVPFAEAAEPWRKAVVAEFVQHFGAIDPVAMTMLASAALQLAASRWGFTYADGRFTANPFDPHCHEYVSGDAQEFVRASKLAKDANDSVGAAWAWCERVASKQPSLPSGNGVPSLQEAFGT